ncbi:MAG TPA: 4-alpha-glucanotransferase, partial [Erysipelothrix sp.]|nr:4-alpha-glucanotransferase [Erysipelothrix sp.]
MKRQAGLLLSVSSLPGTMGIGDFGQDAYDFVRNLNRTGATIWQLLPLNPVGYGNSPYQTYSSFAGDEIYISIETLFDHMGLDLDFDPIVSDVSDYDLARKLKREYLKIAYANFEKDADYKAFVKKAFWLKDYATFMALRKKNDYTAWIDWEQTKPDKEDVAFEYFIQYIFYKQWMNLKDYANVNGIKIMGDIPIYIGHDSHEVYFNREIFHLDKDGRPTLVAGVPPDYFSTEGQLWGNPIYDWDKLEAMDYKFWVERLAWNQLLFDTIRIDHFRAFDTYWAIPADSKTAKNGEWKIGPRNKFFDSMFRQIDNLDLVVEDLGDLRPEVLELRDDYDLMGMQIIQFSLKSEEIKRDIDMPENILAYTGTHDNQPLGGAVSEMTFFKKLQVKRDLKKRGIKDRNLIDRINHYALSLKANMVILPAQDIMRLGKDATMNSPGTVGSPNWEWKLKDLRDLDEGLNRF